MAKAMYGNDPAPIPCSAFNSDGTIYAYALSYDWSRGFQVLCRLSVFVMLVACWVCVRPAHLILSAETEMGLQDFFVAVCGLTGYGGGCLLLAAGVQPADDAQLHPLARDTGPRGERSKQRVPLRLTKP